MNSKDERLKSRRDPIMFFVKYGPLVQHKVSLIVGALLIATGALGQAPPQMNSVNDETQTPIVGVGHNYQNLLGETVNFSNGSVNFKLSFPVPKSRGFTLPYAWSYNSAAVNPLNFIGGNQPGWDVYSTQPQQVVVDGWNWAEGTPYATVQVFQYSAPPNPYQTFAPCNVQTGMTFVDMDGVTHNLYTSAMAPASTGSGTIATCEAQTHAPNGDGEVAAKLDPNTAANQLASTLNPINGTFIVMDKNGTTYAFPYGEVGLSFNGILYPTIEDRNGNVTGTGGDTAGRQEPVVNSTSTITIPVSSQVNQTFGVPTSVTVDNMTYTAVWGTTNVSYTVALGSAGLPASGSDIGCVGTIPTTISGQRLVLESLKLPNSTTANPQIYTFQYDPSYGTLEQITYPDGGWVKYQWQLSSTQNELAEWAGELTSIVNGSYVYTPVNFGCGSLYQTPVLASRTVSFDGKTIAQTQSFYLSTSWDTIDGSIGGWTQKETLVTTTDNINGLTSATQYTYIPYTVADQPLSGSRIAQQIPLESSIAYYDWGQTPKETVPAGTPIKTVTKTWLDQFNMASQTTTINATGQISGTVYKFVDASGINAFIAPLVYLKEQDDYDFGSGPIPVAGVQSSRVPIKRTVYSYNSPKAFPTGFMNNSTGLYTASGDTNPLVLPPQISSVTVENGSGMIESSTNFTYDSTTIGSLTKAPTAHDAIYATSVSNRDNVTSITRCNPLPVAAGGACTGPTTTYTYDITGQPATKTDPCGNSPCADLLPSGTGQITTFSFSDSYSSGGGSPANNLNSNTYLSSVTYPTAPSGLQLGKSFTYNWNMGQLATSTDENNQTTTYSYADPLGRLTSIVGPSAVGSPTTNFTYNDGVYSSAWGFPNVETSIEMNSNVNKVTETFSDGMGHSVGTEVVSDPDGADYTQISYDGMGNVLQQFNPSRSASGAPYTTFRYDAIGRKIEQIAQDGTSTQQWCYDNTKSSPAQANCHGQIGTQGGSWADFKDEDGNDWQRTSDGLARLTHVIEPSGASTTPSLETDYSYDALNNLLCAVQKGTSGAPLTSCASAPAAWRPRGFVYDSLSRLLVSTNPETGTIGYSYDLDGNLQTKTNARGITTNYMYDAINRLTAKTYSNDPTTTPVSCYAYDLSCASGFTGSLKGRVTCEWSQSQSAAACTGTYSKNANQWTVRSFNYDALGRDITEQQCTPSNCASSPYQLNFAFDLASNLTSLTNGSTSNPITFTNCFDTAGHLQTVTSSLVGATYPQSLFSAQFSAATCAGISTAASTSAAYTAFDTLQNFIYGNGSITLDRTYDPRLRLINETDVSVSPPTPGSATVFITGSEQSH